MCINAVVKGQREESTKIVNTSVGISKRLTMQRARKLRREAKTMLRGESSNAETNLRRQIDDDDSTARSGNGSSSSTGGIKKDFIAVATAQTRRLVNVCSELLKHFTQTKAYTILFKTTQPAHLVTLVAIATIAAVVFPKQPQAQLQASRGKFDNSPLMNFIYLASFSVHFGFQMWMTFISGLSLYFSLPRHTFGGVQRVLFPKYFGCNSFLSVVTLIVFVKLQSPSWDTDVIAQVTALAVCFLVELTIRLYLTPPLLQLMVAKNELEVAAGVGLEVGEQSVGSLDLCPHYLRLHNAFRTVHMTVAAGNILAMACNMYHLCYLSTKICLAI